MLGQIENRQRGGNQALPVAASLRAACGITSRWARELLRYVQALGCGVGRRGLEARYPAGMDWHGITSWHCWVVWRREFGRE